MLLLPRHQVGGIHANRRKNIFHLIKHQCHLRAAFQENLGNLQRTITVAPTERIAVAIRILHLIQVQPRRLCNHFGQLCFTGTRRTVKQNIDTQFFALNRIADQSAQHLCVFLHKRKIAQTQRRLAGRLGKHRHQFALVAVLAHQHRRQLLADFHQVRQIGDAVLRNQVFNQANALQPRAGAQGFAHLAGRHAGHFGNGGIGFWRIVDLELHQKTAQITLVACQRAIQQQRSFGFVELQQIAQGGDVFFDQGAVLFQGVCQPIPCDGQYRKQIFGLIFGEFIQIEK